MEISTIIVDFEEGAVGAGEDQVVPTGFGAPYRDYYLDPLKLEALNPNYDKDAIASILQERDVWVYPLIDGPGKVISSARVGRDDDGWSLWEVPTYSSNEAVEFSANEVAIKAYLAAQGVDDVENIKIAHFSLEWQNHMDLLFFESAKEPYIVPLSRNFGDLKLENKKVYRAADVLEVLAAKVADKSDDEPPAPESPETYGVLKTKGAPIDIQEQDEKDLGDRLLYPFVVFIGGLVGGGIAFTIWRRARQ